MTYTKKVKCNKSIDLENDNDINTIYHLVSAICYCIRNTHTLNCHSQLCQANNQLPKYWRVLQKNFNFFFYGICTSLGLFLQNPGCGSSTRQYVFLVVEKKSQRYKLAVPCVSVWTCVHHIAGIRQGYAITP